MNPTAGGAGDVPFVLERLLALGAQGALVASIPDPAAVARCHGAGVGAAVDLELGGKLDPVHGRPLRVRGEVRSLHEIPWSVGTSGEQIQRVVVLADPANVDLHPILKKCIEGAVELGMELGHYQDVIEACDLYLKVFPRGEKLEEMRKLKREAQRKLVE